MARIEYHNATNTGLTLEQIAGKDAVSECVYDGGIGLPMDNPLEQASHALICGSYDIEDPVDIACDICGYHHLDCICDDADDTLRGSVL